MTLLIRAAVPADRPELAAMLDEVLDYFIGLEPAVADERPTAEQVWACSGFSFTAEPFCWTLLPEVDGKLAGYLAYHFGVWECFSALYVAGLYVRPSYRRHGVGRRLMEEAQAIARARGATHLVWEVWRHNPQAIAFYRSIGAETFDDNLRMVVSAG